MIRAIVLWLFLISTSAAQNCQQVGCAPGYCCSKWGYCGNTPLHCEGNQSGNICNPPCQPGYCCSKWGFCGNTEQHCTSGGSTTRLSTLITTSSLLSSSTSNTPSFMSTTNVPISSTSSLISTTNVPISSTSSPMSTTNVPSTSSLMSTTSTLPVTSTTGNQEPTMTRERFDCIFSLLSPNVRDQRWQGYQEALSLTSFQPQSQEELMMFFAHTYHETGGLSTYEQHCGVSGACANDYQESWCSPVQAESGKKYYGRGWFQLSWPCNYNAAGKALGVDFLKNPEKVAESDAYAAATAMWFWQANKMGEPARNGNFAGTTKIINPIECGTTHEQNSRIEAYQKVRQCFGLSRETTNLSC